MKEKILYSIANEINEHYPILHQKIACVKCSAVLELEYASNLEKIIKECPSCKHKMAIRLS